MYQGRYARKKKNTAVIWILAAALFVAAVVLIVSIVAWLSARETEPAATMPAPTTYPVTETTEAPTETTVPIILLDPDFSGYPVYPEMAACLTGGQEAAEGPYVYPELALLENTQIDHINVFAARVQNWDDRQYMTVSLLDVQTGEVLSEYPFYAKADALGSLEPQRIVSLYPQEPVTVAPGQTLAFSKAGDPLTWCLGSGEAVQGYHTGGSLEAATAEGVLGVDIYTNSPAPNSASEVALKGALEGKKLSILGDSISTFTGWSNSTLVNSSLGSNGEWFVGDEKLPNVEMTWWHQAASRYGMEVLVNNSWSQSSVTSIQELGEASWGWNTRPEELHDNTLDDNPEGQPIYPDIVAVYMGTNDLINGAASGGELDEAFWQKAENGEFAPEDSLNFALCYARMIHKIKANYPGVTVFCFDIPTMLLGPEPERAAYNRNIAAIAQHYGCHLVQLYDTDLSDFETYTAEGIHPNEAGMDIMTNAFGDSLKRVYGN